MDEITAEITVEAVVPQIRLRVKPHLSFGAKTDMGKVRENNEDKHEFFIAEKESDLAAKGHVFVVCDGMGGHEAGQCASEIACKTFIDVYRSHPSEDYMAATRAAVTAATRFIHDISLAIPSRKGMGTTLVALIFRQDAVLIVNVGDSRAYRLRNGEVEQLTTDHTWVEETVAAGMMTREEAEAHPYRHVITRALGTERDVACDLFEHPLAEGDVFMVCSDGVTNHVADDQIGRILATAHPSEAAWRLVGDALVGGGSDNATAIVVRVDGLEFLETDQ
ncbi:MAG: Stp1/IreP family PP2C-type Ser/Thr phosphatase [Armatimonadetes bacterium]|nr:Stp1/IreP family PP2C-type Ser/Thr phosphatase [Armatimonadota bacterium]MBS1710146.1 Stp1/IreP family PP2C-type Ser/Thr phosphatase [Armatimonadota bacterium]MBX3110036.1 Stp1/IreP family PP2C-type Ser/Thr phosphatase [Fimbriimonadaceae bacterium]